LGHLRLCRVETRREVVDDAHQFVGVDLFGGGGAAGDLLEQRSRGAAVGVPVAVLRGQVGPDERFEVIAPIVAFIRGLAGSYVR
jgi:hypothetical protein